MSMKNHNIRRNNLGVSTIGFVVVVVILLVVAAGGFALYATKSPSTKSITSTISSTTTETTTVAPSNTSQAANQVTALAYSHWVSIGSQNLTAVMSQYGSSAVLGWYVNPSSALNGTYTNSSAIKSTWTKFFDANPTTYYTIYNYTLSINGSSATANADIWYVLGNGTVTLKLPYELNYQIQNGSWVLTGDWWGLPNQPGTVVHGVVPIITVTTNTTSTTSSTTSTTSTTSTNTTQTASA
ncbi:MAG: hypothetical protein M1368_06215 [Thaumarchaeota archaeon]|nr:hypothetical protein [Nitrososphaerota archaeon]